MEMQGKFTCKTAAFQGSKEIPGAFHMQIKTIELTI